MKCSIVFLAIFISFSATSQKLAIQINLEDCHQKSRLNYPLIQQFELIEKSKDYTLSNANKAYLPQLSITAIGGIIDGFPQLSVPGAEASASNDMQLLSIIQFNQVLWDGGTTKARKGIASMNSEIEKADIEVSLHALKERVNGIYFGILLIDGQIEQMNLLMKNLERNREKVQAYFDNGTAFKSDLDEIKVKILDAQQKNQELYYNRIAYVEMLSTLIGEQLAPNVKLQKPLITNAFSELEIRRPELELFENQLELLASKRDLDKSKVNPKIGLLGFGTFVQPGVPFGTQELNRILVAGLSVSWEFGSLYQRGNNKNINEIDSKRIQNKKETFIFSTELQLAQIKKEAEKIETMLLQDREMIKLKTSIKDSYQSKYDNGVTTMSELLNRINDENMANQNYVLHEIQYLMSMYQYKTVSGN